MAEFAGVVDVGLVLIEALYTERRKRTDCGYA